MLAAGALATFLSALSAGARAALLLAGVADLGWTLLRHRRNGRSLHAIQLRADGRLRCLGPDGWHAATLLPGSFRLGNLAWLRIHCRGTRAGELITRRNSGEAAWRRFCVIWRYSPLAAAK
jgi:hypothetical protein